MPDLDGLRESNNLSTEHKRAISEGRKRYFEQNPEAHKGKNNPNFGNHSVSPFKGKNHTKGSKKKMSESRKRWLEKHPDFNKGEENPMFGVSPSLEHREKIRKKMLGREVSWADKISKGKSGIPMMENTKRILSELWKRRYSSGYMNPMKGRMREDIAYPTPYFVEELGHKVRSSWEAEICTTLKEAGIEYEYESTRFPIFFNDAWHNYTPDLILDSRVVIEVKGPLFDSGAKLKAFHEQYSDLKFILVGNGSSEICDVFIPWEEREKLVDVVATIR